MSLLLGALEHLSDQPFEKIKTKISVTKITVISTISYINLYVDMYINGRNKIYKLE